MWVRSQQTGVRNAVRANIFSTICMQATGDTVNADAEMCEGGSEPLKKANMMSATPRLPEPRRKALLGSPPKRFVNFSSFCVRKAHIA